MPTSQRNAVIDCMRALACAAIVAHHLALYCPLPALARELAPALVDGLVDYARMAVQVFLVLGGYLAVASLAPQGGARFGQAGAKIGQRFVRLVVPYAVALAAVIVVSAAVRPWLDDPAVSPDPDLTQLLAHALLLHGVLGEESLSAGVWYVAVDFQLFALTVLLLAALRRWVGAAHRARAGQALLALLTAASLLHFNRDPAWDDWALYFFGAYGLGMMAWWSVHARAPEARAWQLAIAALVVAALALHWRERVALAGVTALALAVLLRRPAVAAWPGLAPLRWLGRISYSVFLAHFAVCLLVGALVDNLWPGSVPAAALGLLAGFGLSLAAGWWLYQRVERHVPTWHSALRWQAGLVGTGVATALLAGLR